MNMAGFYAINPAVEQLPVTASFDFGDALSAHGFTLFASLELARFFIGFSESQPFEQAVVLNFFLQNFHGLFQVVVNDADFNLFHIPSPFLSFVGYRSFFIYIQLF